MFHDVWLDREALQWFTDIVSISFENDLMWKRPTGVKKDQNWVAQVGTNRHYNLSVSFQSLLLVSGKDHWLWSTTTRSTPTAQGQFSSRWGMRHMVSCCQGNLSPQKQAGSIWENKQNNATNTQIIRMRLQSERLLPTCIFATRKKPISAWRLRKQITYIGIRQLLNVQQAQYWNTTCLQSGQISPTLTWRLEVNYHWEWSEHKCSTIEPILVL